MKSAIDKLGRVVIPKQLRDELGLGKGQEIEFTAGDGVLEIRAATIEVELVETPEGLVAVPLEPVPVLTAAQVREKIDQIRK